MQKPGTTFLSFFFLISAELKGTKEALERKNGERKIDERNSLNVHYNDKFLPLTVQILVVVIIVVAIYIFLSS